MYVNLYFICFFLSYLLTVCRELTETNDTNSSDVLDEPDPNSTSSVIQDKNEDLWAELQLPSSPAENENATDANFDSMYIKNQLNMFPYEEKPERNMDSDSISFWKNKEKKPMAGSL